VAVVYYRAPQYWSKLLKDVTAEGQQPVKLVCNSCDNYQEYVFHIHKRFIFAVLVIWMH
jgi:hypothetical protein